MEIKVVELSKELRVCIICNEEKELSKFQVTRYKGKKGLKKYFTSKCCVCIYEEARNRKIASGHIFKSRYSKKTEAEKELIEQLKNQKRELREANRQLRLLDKSSRVSLHKETVAQRKEYINKSTIHILDWYNQMKQQSFQCTLEDIFVHLITHYDTLTYLYPKRYARLKQLSEMWESVKAYCENRKKSLLQNNI